MPISARIHAYVRCRLCPCSFSFMPIFAEAEEGKSGMRKLASFNPHRPDCITEIPFSKLSLKNFAYIFSKLSLKNFAYICIR